MTQFILLLRGGYEAYEGFTPEQVQQAIQKYRTWSHNLKARGALVGALKLRDEGGHRLEIQNGQLVVDGPFAETKETIAGYFVIRAADYAAACAIAKECPVLADGGSVEVREIESEST